MTSKATRSEGGKDEALDSLQVAPNTGWSGVGPTAVLYGKKFRGRPAQPRR